MLRLDNPYKDRRKYVIRIETDEFEDGLDNVYVTIHYLPQGDYFKMTVWRDEGANDPRHLSTGYDGDDLYWGLIKDIPGLRYLRPLIYMTFLKFYNIFNGALKVTDKVTQEVLMEYLMDHGIMKEGNTEINHWEEEFEA